MPLRSGVHHFGAVHLIRCSAWLLWTLGLSACDTANAARDSGEGGHGGQTGDNEWSIEFKLVSGGDEVSCGAPWDHVGTSRSEVQLRAFAFYVHDLKLIRDGGKREALELVADDAFQSSEVALLDFDDGTGRCAVGTAEQHSTLHLRGGTHDELVGLEFTLGVPQDLNHLDLAGATSPLNQPEMYWSWQGGYKFLRLELESPKNPKGYLVHVGSMECEGSPALGYECGAENRAHIELTGDPSNGVIVDVSALLAGVDVDVIPDGVTDVVAGCMSNATDPECLPVYGALGLPFGDEPAPSDGQRVFRLR